MHKEKNIVNGNLENEWALKEFDDGTKIWYNINGCLMKYYNPLTLYTGYYDDKGKHHRLDGPARIWHIGAQEWWYHGTKIHCKSQEEFERYLKLKAFW